MAGMREQAKSARYDEYMRLLANTPHSIYDLVKETGVAYGTVRRDLLYLAEQKQIRPSPNRDESGNIMWYGGAMKPMPVIHVKVSNKTMPLSALSDAYVQALREGGNRTTESALDVLAVATDLMHKVYFIQEGGTLREADLLVLKKTLADAIKFLDSTMNLAEQMLNNYTLWSIDRLTSMIADEDFNAERMESNYQEANVLRNAKEQ